MGLDMTEEELRQHFDIKPHTGKRHEFTLGRLMGEWAWSNTSWSSLAQGRMNTYYLSYQKIQTFDNIKAYTIVIWKLKIIWSILNKGKL
jgi:hypothetical protein